MRFIPHLVSLVGLVVVLYAIGCYCGASMPYQEPTPELLAVQRGQIESAKTVGMLGGVVVVGGVAWIVVSRISRLARMAK